MHLFHVRSISFCVIVHFMLFSLCDYNFIYQLFYLRRSIKNEHLLTHTAISQKSLTLNNSLKFNIPLTELCFSFTKIATAVSQFKFLRLFNRKPEHHGCCKIMCEFFGRFAMNNPESLNINTYELAIA